MTHADNTTQTAVVVVVVVDQLPPLTAAGSAAGPLPMVSEEPLSNSAKNQINKSGLQTNTSNGE